MSIKTEQFIKLCKIIYNHKIMYKKQGVFGTQLNIYGGAFCEKSWQLKVVNIFVKKLHHRLLVGL